MKLVIAFALMAAASLAGCAGDFRIDQTEPIRVQIEDGNSSGSQESTERVVLTASEPSREFAIENNNRQSQTVQVNVQAEQRSEEPAEVVVIVRDADTEEEIERQTIVIQNNVVQNVDLEIEGDRNVVVVTQVVEGEAAVAVTADQSDAAQADESQATPPNGDLTDEDERSADNENGNDGPPFGVARGPPDDDDEENS